jgi:regulator of cell morphogenesis and NO signaling
MFKKNNIFISSDFKVSDIVFDNTYFIIMLEHFGIDFAFHEKTIEQVCKDYNINIELFLTIANLFNGFKPSSTAEYSFNDTQVIINYLKKSHLYYLDEKYPEILNYIEKIHQINNHKEIVLVENFFIEYFNEVREHLDYENRIAFPYVLDLLNQIEQKKKDIQCNYSIKKYKERHTDIEEKLADLKNLLIKYLPQNNDYQIRRKLLFSLFELEFDLITHTLIEDLILVPIVKKMEQYIKHENEGKQY